MNIVKERTRIIFSEYNDAEKRAIDNMVATMDNVFTYEDKDKHIICLPTGMEKATKRLFPKHTIVDRSKEYWPFERIQPVEHNAQPRNQLQKDFISFVLEKSNEKQKLAGILSPGVGKTFLACYCAIRLGMRTMIIVPTTSIKNQWADTLTGMFKVDPSRVVNVRKPSDFFNVKADFVVVSQASLAAINKTYDLEEIMRKNKFGIKAIDEVQMWFHNIIKVDGCSNIANNWYLTGTFGRSSDDQNKLYQEMFGDLAMFTEKMKEPTFFNRKPGNIYGMKPHVHCTMVWTRSGLNKEQIKKVTNSMRYSEREGKWMRFGISVPAYTKLVIPPDGTMTKWLNIILRTVKIAMNTIDYGKTLVLGSTISSAEVIASYLRKMYPNLKIGTLHSINDKATNLDPKANAEIIVSTTKSAGTGFDVKGLSRLIVADQFKSWILADQVSGRLRTLDSGKDTYMWDIVDSSIPQLRRWANSRAQVLKRKTKSFKVKEM